MSAHLRLWMQESSLRATLTPEWGEPKTTDATLVAPSGAIGIGWNVPEVPDLDRDAGDDSYSLVIDRIVVE